MTLGALHLGPLPGGETVDEPLWGRLNRALIARAITELSYEEGLSPQPRDAGQTIWELRFEGVAYRFEAVRRIWGQLSVAAESLVRTVDDCSAPPAG